MVAFDPEHTTAISLSVEARTHRSDTHLIYRVTEDGRGISTRLLGAPHSPSVPASLRTGVHDGWHRLVAKVARSDFEVNLAVWQLSEAGDLINAHVRTQPFAEWRPLGLKPGQVVTDVEWRPLIDGIGVGEWRR